MRSILNLMTKEFLLLLRDWHALLLLFLMPVIFILVMSLALQGQFSSREGVRIDFYLVNQDAGEVNDTLLQRLNSLHGFTVETTSKSANELANLIRNGDAKFLVVIPEGFGASLATEDPETLQLLAAPDVAAPVYQLFQARVLEVLEKLRLAQLGGPTFAAAMKNDAAKKLLTARILLSQTGASGLPSSVQQNVPAWLLFAMFFIAIPLSTTWVQERQQGTYARLRSMSLGTPSLLAGKLIPYVSLNLLQVILMLLVGVYVVPGFGGDQLDLGHAPAALALMSGASAFAAVAYGLLIANIVSTSEQATIFTGVANLLMAAVGGIMVPRFIMPHAMQVISDYSPMAWGLDGFLDIFLRDGGVSMVWGEVAKLMLFGGGCLLVAAAWMRWRRTG